MLPIVQRELRVGARDPKMYKGRLRIGLAVIACAAILLLTLQSGGGGVAGGAFWAMSWLALLFCLLEGVRKTSDSISEERREGTLGFLFLTELRGFDIALGKFAGAFIRSLSGLLAFVPILAITLLMGGTTHGEFWRTVLALGLALTLSLSICLAISAARKERSTALCMGFLSVLCVAPPIAVALLRGVVHFDLSSLSAISPAGLLKLGTDAAMNFNSKHFWIGAALQAGMILAALAFASRQTARRWQDDASRPQVTTRTETPEAQTVTRARRSELLNINPILWLAYSGRQHQRFNRFFAAIAGLFTIGGLLAYLEGGATLTNIFLGFGVVVLGLILVVHMSSQASINLAEAKSNGTLELLLSTPLKVRDIVRGQWLALRKTFSAAVLTILLFVLVMVLLMLQIMNFGNAIWLSKTIVELVLEFFVLGWVGMWSGLVSKTANGAFFRTFALGFLLPFLLCTPTILNQIILLAVAMDKVNVQFRRFVAEKYLQDPKFVLPPALANPGAPPVLR